MILYSHLKTNTDPRFLPVLLCVWVLVFTGCNDGEKKPKEPTTKQDISLVTDIPENIKVPEGMVWIPGGVFTQGALDSDQQALNHERPAHPVSVDGFFIDKTEVTNEQFKKFIDATGYVTIAERPVDWEELKTQLPPGTPKPHDSVLQPGSLLFHKTPGPVPNLFDYSQWWEWKIGTNWKHPQGPDSSIEGKENYPVVHIAYEDALAYCEWAGRRLPTEAEWEFASRGSFTNSKYNWGDERNELETHANSWTGRFPDTNSATDGYENKAPVKSFPPNSYGLYDMAGNVWEWTSDWYNTNYYQEALNQGTLHNPSGAAKPFNPNNPYVQEKVIKGGSFLCNDDYCSSYRISARMATELKSSQEHLGFRTVATPEMLKR
ncbi:formylglycine-generating enzyme family protein [Robertkochia solimangrovi]|uniref:formylglycine-generating enzyme family protein n=1 Tax=Robertkochia solimangrovi TaxID=2213046 RepID=UPI0011817446|nr:formylglycine-generating enzyme family protein [Robertkochia solimangrovi]TRZ44461.1 formylglycine-generating enzyme family protein [Robertkochia solimangrovi]